MIVGKRTNLKNKLCAGLEAHANDPTLSAKRYPTEPVNKVWLGAFLYFQFDFYTVLLRF